MELKLPFIPVPQRLLEEAVDELARLDTTCNNASPSASEALWLATVAELAGEGKSGVRDIAAALADPIAEQRASSDLLHWYILGEEEERRVVGGIALSRARVARMAPPGSQPDMPEEIDAAGYGAPGESVMQQALRVRLGVTPAGLGEMVAALVLCASGRMGRVRFLPFAGMESLACADHEIRAKNGDRDSLEVWTAMALEAMARSARARRQRVEQAAAAAADEDERVRSIGRAGITAMQALVLMREELCCTMPSLAQRLELSRPAAGNTIERLEDLGLVTEITGRRRDRVYAYTPALELAEAFAG